MKVAAVNIGRPRPLEVGGRQSQTGIFKEPVEGAVEVNELGLAGDAVIDGRHHGGPDQAVYLYRLEDYEFWGRQLRKEIAPGTFGDNLTVSGLSSPALMVGDVLRFPDLELQVTAPRIPCNTLAARMGDKKFPKAFVKAARPGIYFRVLKSGTIRAGQTVELIPFAEDSISTVRFFNDFQRTLTSDEMQRYLQLPIDIRSRTYLEGELNKRGVPVT